MSIFEKEQNQKDESDFSDFKGYQIDQIPTLVNLKVVHDWDAEDYWAVDKTATWIMPVISIQHVTDTATRSQSGIISSAESHVAPLRKLVKSSGIYAIASVAPPLVALALSPFLTGHLSPTDYGALTLLTTLIGLGAGISQLGLGSAFFRAYSYDFTSRHERREVLATVNSLLALVSVPVAAIMTLLAPVLALLLFHRISFAGNIALAGVVILLQNLTIPGFAWFRAESRPILYSILSTCSLLVTLLATLVLVGVFHQGIAGSLIATGCGYAGVVLSTTPVIVYHAGIKIRIVIARSLLSFGFPLVFNFVSYWVLQLSDRYLLSLFGSLEQTAKYSVVYTLGSAMSVLVMGPFTLAWPTVMFTIAQRNDAPHIFQLVFRWFSLFLLFAAFALSLVATLLLDLLYPATYRSVALIIPIVTISNVFYGVYFVFSIGVNIKNKTWLIAVFTSTAALVNLLLNLLLIPLYQSLGAAVSTLLAYVSLVTIAYIINQRLYPIRFELGMFAVALLVGITLYVGSDFLAREKGLVATWSIHLCALCLYSGLLLVLGKWWKLNKK